MIALLKRTHWQTPAPYIVAVSDVLEVRGKPALLLEYDPGSDGPR
jgi:hypothetical protein